MAQPVLKPDLRPIDDAEKLEAVFDALSEYDLPNSDAWNDLDQLSTHTVFEELDASPEGVFETAAGGFKVVGTVYVTLNYGDKNDQTSMSDSYPALLTGSFEESGKAIVDHLEVDTSSFYN